MKRFLFATMMMMATTAFASENDTLIIEKPQRVIIITSDSLQSIHVKGKEGDNQFDYQNTIQLLEICPHRKFRRRLHFCGRNCR